MFARGLLNAPAKFSVKTEQYPLARRLFLYSIGTPSESVARDIPQFALSDAAQATVTEAEFTDQSVEFQDSNEQRLWVQTLASDPSVGLEAGKLIPPATVSIFNSTMQRMNRSTIVFRFEYGKSDLDAKVVQDIARLAATFSRGSWLASVFSLWALRILLEVGHPMPISPPNAPNA